MILPKNEPREIIPDKRMRFFIYGEPYTGKTTFASKFPAPVILSSDGNYDLLSTPAITLTSTMEWVKAIEELEKGDHTFETIIVDVVDQFFDVYREEFLKAKGKEHETDLNMKGWEMVRKPFKNLIYRLASLPYNIIFIGHSKDKLIKDRFGNETTKTTYVLPEDLANYITSLVKATFYTSVEQTKTKGQDGIEIYEKKHFLYLNTMDDTRKGGSRILFTSDKIELDFERFMEVFKESIEKPITEKPVDKSVKQIKTAKPLKPLDKPKTEKSVSDIWS